MSNKYLPSAKNETVLKHFILEKKILIEKFRFYISLQTLMDFLQYMRVNIHCIIVASCVNYSITMCEI